MKQMSVDEFEYGEERLDLSPLSQKHSDYDDDYDQDRYNSYYKNDCRDSYRNELPQNQMIVKADSRIRSDQRSIPRDNFARQDSYSSRKSPQRQNSGRYNSYSRSPLSPALTPSNSISMMRTNTCGGCKRPITDLSRGFEIEVLGTWFHDTCFRCEKCDVVFDERNPFVPWNGGVLCEPDFEVRNRISFSITINHLPF